MVTQKIVSKAEGRLVPVDPDDPNGHKPIVEDESVSILRRRGDLLISETSHGFVCANAGIDLSNVERGYAALLPEDCDRSARRIRDGLRARAGVTVARDRQRHVRTHVAPWRDRRGDRLAPGIGAIVDLPGHHRRLRAASCRSPRWPSSTRWPAPPTWSWARRTGIPVAVVRGVDPAWLRRGEVRAEIVRPPAEDLFR